MLEAKIKLLIADLENTLKVLDKWQDSTTNKVALIQIEAKREAYEAVLNLRISPNPPPSPRPSAGYFFVLF